MTIEITRTAEINIPPVPDHVRKVGTQKATVDVASLTDESVDSLINIWGVQFRENVESRRAARGAKDPETLGGEVSG